MKKNFKYYFGGWLVMLALFNVMAFVVSGRIPGTERFDTSFWIGYLFVTIAFLGQLAIAFYAFRSEKLDKLFYRISLIQISWIGLILTIVFGGACMLVPRFPVWLGVLLCFAVLAFCAVSLLKAGAAGEIVADVDNKVKAKTVFIRSLTVDAESLLPRAKSESVKAECKKVYEAVRYADPMSNDALAEVETQITLKFSAFAKAVADDDAETVKSVGEEVCILLNDRNKRCKVLK